MKTVLDLPVDTVAKAVALQLLGSSALTVKRGESVEGTPLALGMAGELVAVRASGDTADDLVLEMAGHSAAEMRQRFRALPEEGTTIVTRLREHSVEAAP